MAAGFTVYYNTRVLPCSSCLIIGQGGRWWGAAGLVGDGHVCSRLVPVLTVHHNWDNAHTRVLP